MQENIKGVPFPWMKFLGNPPLRKCRSWGLLGSPVTIRRVGRDPLELIEKSHGSTAASQVLVQSNNHQEVRKKWDIQGDDCRLFIALKDYESTNPPSNQHQPTNQHEPPQVVTPSVSGLSRKLRSQFSGWSCRTPGVTMRSTTGWWRLTWCLFMT